MTPEFELLLRSAVPWVLPPFLGAVIGYMTNALAIRMLFRPLHAWRILGVRIPFTPGVIPRQRADLAERIGRMVSDELLTSEVFERRFASARFRHSLQRAIVAVVDKLADTPLSAVREAVRLDDLLRSTITARSMAWAGDVVASRITDHVRAHRDQLSARIGPLLSHLPDEAVNHALERIWPSVTIGVGDLLHSPEIRTELENRARRILHYSLDQLSSIQRLVVSAGQFDRQLESRVPEIVDRTIAEIMATVKKPETAQYVARAAYRWVENHGDEVAAVTRDALGDILSDDQQLRQAVRAVWDTLVSANDQPAALLDGIEHLLDSHADAPLGVLIPALVKRRASFAHAAAARIQGILASMVGSFVMQLDVRSVVVDRVNDLDVARVEGLLLGIIKRHLGWINVFGALLGAIIGALQIVLRLAGLA